jgi:hypothetical protein
MRSFLNASFALLVLGAIPCLAMIDVGHLSREEAAKLGITMKQRPDGDAGVRVWLEFKLEGFLEKFTYAELRVENASGKHLVSARLEPHPVVHGQSKDLLSVAFSADPSQLAQCSFMIVAYGSSRGDVGYVLKVKEFLDLDGVILADPPSAKVKVGETAPVVDALLSDGSPLDPKDLAGKVVLLIFGRLIGMDGKVAAARLAAGELRGAVARALEAGR